jgi:NAD+ kinase
LPPNSKIRYNFIQLPRFRSRLVFLIGAPRDRGVETGVAIRFKLASNLCQKPTKQAGSGAARRWHPRSIQPTDRVCFVTNGTPEADAAAARLQARYGDHAIDDADIVVALGGDGLMLQTLHRVMRTGVPVYGMNFGSVGFMMNAFSEDDLDTRLASVQRTRIYPLSMQVLDTSGKSQVALALNEVSLFRSTYQAAKIQIVVDGETRLDELICDGVLLSTPAGSTAYNLSAHGPILPIEAPLLALTPISPFRPRRWRGAILSNRAEVRFITREAAKRPVSAVADNVEFQNVLEVTVREDRTHAVTLLFDPGTSLEERVLSEQFRF